MRRALILALALALLLLPSSALALPWGYPPSQGVAISDPTATSASPKTFRGTDQDSDAADEWYALGVSIMMPGATPTQVSALAPFPVYTPAAFPGPTNLVQVGGVAYSLGTAQMPASIPITLATDDTVMLAIDVLLTAIEVDTTAIAVSAASIDAKLPATLGPKAPAASLSIVQDSTGAWTVVEASAAGILADTGTIAGDTTSLDGKVPTLTLASQAPAASLSVVQDSTGAWTVVEASGAAIAGSVASLDGHVPQLTLAAQAPAASLSVVQDSTGAWTVVEASGATIAGDTTSLDTKIPTLSLAAQAPAASLSVVQDSTGAWTVVEASGATIAGDTTSLDTKIPTLTLGAAAPAASLSVVQDSTGAWTVTPVIAFDQGAPSATTTRTVEAQPDDNEDGLLNIDQTNAAACGVPYAIPADAHETTCQNQDDADYIRVRAVDAADTSTGYIIAPQSAGAGQTFTTHLRGVNLCFFNDTQDANAVVYCASTTEQ